MGHFFLDIQYQGGGGGCPLPIFLELFCPSQFFPSTIWQFRFIVNSKKLNRIQGKVITGHLKSLPPFQFNQGVDNAKLTDQNRGLNLDPSGH